MKNGIGPARKTFRDRYLAVITALVLLLCSTVGHAQIFKNPNPGLFGVTNTRGDFDSVLYFPTGCGAPSGIASLQSVGFGNGEKKRKAAIFADTCGHSVYWFDWSDTTWKQFGSGSSGSDSGIVNGLWITVDRNTATFRRVNSDSAGMASYFLRRKDSGVYFITPKRLADTAATLRGLISSGFDSTTSQGGGFHTQAYNDARYKRLVDSLISTGSYATIGRLYKVADSLSALADTTINRSTGATGLPIFTQYNVGKVYGLNFPLIRDTSLSTSRYAPDSAFVIATHDTTSPNALASKAQVDTAKNNIRNGIKQADWTQATTTDPSYIKNKPALGTAAAKNVPSVGVDATTTQVVMGDDSRLTNSRSPSGVAGGVLNGNYPSPGMANGVVGNSQMANMAAGSVKGNTSGSSATPMDVSFSTLAAALQSYISFPSILHRYNVVDYGADTTGANANATQRGINKCIAAAMASPYPACVTFPSGAYSIDSALIPITKTISIEGYNAYIKCSNTNSFTIFSIQTDSFNMRGIKLIGNTRAQKGIEIDGHKYFSISFVTVATLNVGIRFVRTSNTFNAGDLNAPYGFDCNTGLQSDTLGEYVTVRGGLFERNLIAVLNDGGNNKYIGLNANNNTTAFKFTGGSNNGHGIVDGCAGNHNAHSIDANGVYFGYTINSSHFYEGDMVFRKCANFRFTGQCVIGASSITIDQCANMDFRGCMRDPTFGTTIILTGNFNKPLWGDNMGAAATTVVTPTGTVSPLVDSLGGFPYRSPLTSDTLDLGIARWQYKSLSADDTIKSVIHGTAGRTYRLEVQANGHNMVFLDNAKIDGTFNPSAPLNVYYIEVIDDGPDQRFIVRVTQPGILVSRPTTTVGYGRATGTATTTGGVLSKTGPDGLAFTVWGVPDKALGSGDGYFSCQAISTYGNIIFGLSKTASQNSYNTIDYGIYFFGSSGGANNINIAENGTLISSGLGGTNWSTNDSFRVKVTGTTVTYEKYSAGAWNVFYTSTHAVTAYPLIPQAAIRALTTFTNPRIIGAGVINNLQSNFAVQYADGINATASAGGSSYYQTVQSNGTNQTQRAKLNYSSQFTTTDNSGNNSTDISLTSVTTQLPGDNSTKPASTAYVDAAVSAVSGTGTSNYFIATGTGTNHVSSVTVDTCYYIRVGNVVMVDGGATVTASATGGGATFEITLPIASNMGTQSLHGEATSNDGLSYGIVISASATTGKAQLAYAPTTTNPAVIKFHYTYYVR